MVACLRRDFFENKKLDGDIKAKFIISFKNMANRGRIDNKQKFRRLDGPIYEFKCKTSRILSFQKGTTWYLTHGFSGKSGSGKCPRKEIEKAKIIMEEHLQGYN